MDHTITWLKDGRPAVITTAPYEIYEEDEARLQYWQQHDPRLQVARGHGWYGYDTTQIVLWRTDRITAVAAVQKTGD
ncbi:hypothetical protein BM536_037700 [Streptomyces phaeoluteigriseus]|uniref:Uncharacterized protein n=2 Tax=Streptomyces phaeoluteigriseus TaxID=114686 RepID=A0A1V6MHU1_9ACTN|nr:hypothetical protein BM536_037700 [Streptomyces phaeoluteigriseus]